MMVWLVTAHANFLLSHFMDLVITQKEVQKFSFILDFVIGQWLSTEFTVVTVTCHLIAVNDMSLSETWIASYNSLTET